MQYSDIKALVNWLIDALSIPPDELFDGFYIRVPQYLNTEVPQPELGNSCWINEEGDFTSKWSKQEGQVVLQILQKIKDAGISEPDIFFITPFRNVASSIKEEITKSHILIDITSVNTYDWINKRIGTIHTFQGREVETVVIILGASDAASFGALNWAGNSPNLLNVAVTRAKHSLYVIGNRKAWGEVGSFQVLSKYLKDGAFK